MKRLSAVGFICATVMAASTFAPVAHAQRCMTAGGWGTGAFEGFASFMAEAAMKNSAKARLGDDVKIGAEIRIDAAEPRDEDFRTSAAYATYCREVSAALAPSYSGVAVL